MYDELKIGEICGNPRYFEKEFILASGKKGIDPLLHERALHCLEYAAQLRSAGLDFVFKGGTASQLLVAEGLQRLSIDIDISTNNTEKELISVLDCISSKFKNEVYKYYKVPKKGLDKLPLVMFNVEAPTYFPAQKADTMIKLDAILHKPTYAVEKRKVNTFYYESKIEVITPTVNSMLGDKLSTLGPKTIGIPIEDTIGCIKHFYDINNLLRLSTNISEVADAYRKCFTEVISFRNLKIGISEALTDLVNVCKIVTTLPFIPPWVDDHILVHNIKSLSRAVSGFTGYLTKTNTLSRRKLREIAAQTALLSRFICMEIEGMDTKNALEKVRDIESNHQPALDNISELEKEIRNVPKQERWHLHLREIKNAPIAMICWWGYWYPKEFVDLIAR